MTMVTVTLIFIARSDGRNPLGDTRLRVSMSMSPEETREFMPWMWASQSHGLCAILDKKREKKKPVEHPRLSLLPSPSAQM